MNCQYCGTELTTFGCPNFKCSYKKSASFWADISLFTQCPSCGHSYQTRIRKENQGGCEMKLILYILFYICFSWYVITTLIYTFSHPEKTQTQVFLHIPKHLILNFN